MALDVLEASRIYREALAQFDPRLLRWEDALAVHADLARTEKALAAVAAGAAARVAETYAYRREGYADAADWLARASGVGLGEAQSVLRTMERLDDCPETRDALLKGELSLAQAGEIALTATEVPGTEAPMLRDARHLAIKKLREIGLERRLRHQHADDLERRRRERRYFRHWVDDHGLTRGSFAIAPEVGVAFTNRVDVETDRRFRAQARRGETATREQLAADAFATVCATGGKPHATKRDVVLVAGVDTVRTGAVVAGEPCHLLSDAGPVPTSPEVIRRHLSGGDAFVKLVVHDGVHITHVKHEGRRMSAELRTAIGLGEPPLFHGLECSCGCARRKGLQLDHLDPVANRGPTSLANLDPKCRPSHLDKTGADREAGLLVGAGRPPP